MLPKRHEWDIDAVSRRRRPWIRADPTNPEGPAVTSGAAEMLVAIAALIVYQRQLRGPKVSGQAE
jgi:hypothetical protein